MVINIFVTSFYTLKRHVKSELGWRSDAANVAGLEFVISSRRAPSSVFLRILRFSSLHKTDISKFQFHQDRGIEWKPATVRFAKSCYFSCLSLFYCISREEFKFRGWYDAAFRLGQETHQILFELQTRWASRSKSRSWSQDVSSLVLYRRLIPNHKFTSLYAIKIVKYLWRI